MSKKLLSLFSAVIVAAFVITGCGQSDTTNKEQKENAAKENKTEKTDTTKENKPEEKSEDKKTEDKRRKIPLLAPAIILNLFPTWKKKQAENKSSFENKEPQVYKSEDVSVSMNSYTLVELNGFHTDFNIPFNRQTEGGVILVNYSVKNSSAKDIYYMPALDISFTGAQKVYSNYKDLIPKEDQLPTKLAPTNDYLVKAGETISGYIAYPFGKDDLAKFQVSQQSQSQSQLHKLIKENSMLQSAVPEAFH